MRADIRRRRHLAIRRWADIYVSAGIPRKAVAIGVVLDRAVLMDWDGNKPEALGKIISLEALGYELGADLASLRSPTRSVTRCITCGVGLKGLSRSGRVVTAAVRGPKDRQPAHALEPGMILTDDELPPVGELEVAGGVLEEAFNGGYRAR